MTIDGLPQTSLTWRPSVASNLGRCAGVAHRAELEVSFHGYTKINTNLDGTSEGESVFVAEHEKETEQGHEQVDDHDKVPHGMGLECTPQSLQLSIQSLALELCIRPCTHLL